MYKFFYNNFKNIRYCLKGTSMNKTKTTINYRKMEKYYNELSKVIGDKYSSERNEKMKEKIIKTAVETTTTSNDNSISISLSN